MKKILVYVIAFAFTVSIPFSSYSAVNEYKHSEEIELMNQSYAVAQEIPGLRGEVIAKIILSALNLGDGYLGISVQTLTHSSVDKMKVRVYIDILNESTMTWQNEKYFDFMYYAEDFDGNLSDTNEDFQVLAKTGRYYRLRSTHTIWKGSISEGLSGETQGILITK